MWISSQSYTEKEWLLWRFITVCYCLLWWRWDWRGHQKVSVPANQVRPVFVLVLFGWRPLLIIQSASQTPRAERSSSYGYKKISKALTHEANSQFALFSISPYETQSCLFIYFPTTYNTGASTVWSHLLLLLTLTTWGQCCHIERGAHAVMWSRLRWSSLPKVIWTIHQQCCMSNYAWISVSNDRFGQLEKTTTVTIKWLRWYLYDTLFWEVCYGNGTNRLSNYPISWAHFSTIPLLLLSALIIQLISNPITTAAVDDPKQEMDSFRSNMESEITGTPDCRNAGLKVKLKLFFWEDWKQSLL